MNCGHTEKRLVAYLDGKLTIAERRQLEAHLVACPACQERALGFRSVWDVLEELPAVAPSPAFDNRVRARVKQEPRRAGFRSCLRGSL
jgi:anti-sigma factor RsiW